MTAISADLFCGDARDLLAELDDNSVDAVLSDPPYGLADLPPAKVAQALARWTAGEAWYTPEGGRGMMGLTWDAFVPPPGLWTEVLRVLKPGGHAAIFAGSRTQDLMGMSLRLAGFELRDTLIYGYGTGMPKGQGLLKPAYEPILLARKPFKGSARANVATWGVGQLFTDAARIPFASVADEAESKEKNRHGDFGTAHGGNRVYGDYSMLGQRANYDPPGRWPANVLFSHHPDCVQTGTARVRTNSHHPARRGAGGIGSAGHRGQDGLIERRPGVETVPAWECAPGCPVADLDSQSGIDVGGASRFFYCAKASAAERPSYVNAGGELISHSTVKPLAVMRWLARLLCPPGGTVLDMFAGSGTTGEAALLEGFNSILIERERVYLPLIEQRLVRALEQIAEMEAAA